MKKTRSLSSLFLAALIAALVLSATNINASAGRDKSTRVLPAKNGNAPAVTVGNSEPVTTVNNNLPVTINTTAGTGTVYAASGKNKTSPVRYHALKTKPGTVITLSRLQSIGLGQPFTIEGALNDVFGRPVKDRSILFTLNGEFLGSAHTDAYGLFSRKFTRSLDAGNYNIVVYWNGTHDLAPTAVATILHVNPALVKVQTVPVIAGIPFSMDGQRVLTDDQGIATFKIGQAGDYSLTALVEQYSNPTQQIKFGRWLEESYEPTSVITVPADKVIQVGFNVFRQVGQSFVDLDGFPVEPGRISEFMIRSAQGDVFIFHDGQPRWIPSSRIARRVTGLEETRLLYSVISVTIDGSNVVNQSQQRFYTYPTEHWSISLLLYSLKVQARDGLFGFPVGKSVNVTYPDGRVVNYPLDRSGSVVIHSLARGNYYTELVGTYGMKNKTPVALSRNQDVNTNVLTYLDLGFVALLGFLLALGLLFYGRPSLLRFLRRGRKTAPAGVLISELSPVSETRAVDAGLAVDYGSLRYELVRSLDDKEFKDTVGIERDQFENVLSFLRKESTSSGRQAKLSPADQLLLTIVFFREHPTKREIAPAFGISEGTVGRTIRRVKDTLMLSSEFKQLAGNLFTPALVMLPDAAGAIQPAVEEVIE